MEILLFIIFLGLTQGFTEFLPISSSGHLALFENLPIFQNMKTILEQQYSLLAFNVILHLGTIMAVIFYWRKDLIQIIRDFFGDLFHKRYGKGMSITMKIGLTTIPVLCVPFFKHFIDETIHSLSWISLFFILNGFLLFAGHLIRKKNKNKPTKDMNEITYWNALVIGIFQVLAVFPGISRSGSTITAAMFQNVNGESSVKYSFLISIPVLMGAALFEINNIGFSAVFSPDARLDWILIGLFFSFVAGLISLKILVWLGRKVLFYPFGIYTIFLGITVYALLG
ncbi:MAG: undecaprenyl-diphosphate phosphatase [Leptospirales bacterium]